MYSESLLKKIAAIGAKAPKSDINPGGRKGRPLRVGVVRRNRKRGLPRLSVMKQSRGSRGYGLASFPDSPKVRSGGHLSGIEKLKVKSEGYRSPAKPGGANDAAEVLSRRLRREIGRESLSEILGRHKSKAKTYLAGDSILARTAREVGNDLPKSIAKALVGGTAVTGAAKYLHNKISPKTPKQKMVAGLKSMFGKGSAGRKALAFGAGAAAIGAGIDAVTGTQEAVSKPLKKRMYFKRMMAENPSLAREKPEDVKRVFNTMFRFNKRIASDPLVAGSFMRRAMQFKDEGIQPVDIKSLVEATGKNEKKDSVLKSIFPTTASDLRGFAKDD